MFKTKQMIKFNFFSMQCLLHSTDVFKGESIRKMICPIYVPLLLYHFLTDYCMYDTIWI